jgi:hypothetical protein
MMHGESTAQPVENIAGFDLNDARTTMALDSKSIKILVPKKGVGRRSRVLPRIVLKLRF